MSDIESTTPAPDEATDIATQIVRAILAAPAHVKPLEVLKLVSEHREAMIPEFQGAIDDALQLSRQGLLQELGDWVLPGYATAFLAEWKVSGTHQRLLDILKMKDADREWLISDALTEDWPQLLAATFEGDLAPTTEVVLNKRLDEFARAMPVHAVGNLVHAGIVSREAGEAWFGMLFDKLERKESYCWAKLALVVADLKMVELLPKVKKAFERGFCDEYVGGPYADIELAAQGGNPWEEQGMVWRDEFQKPEVDATKMICRWPYYSAKRPDFGNHKVGEKKSPTVTPTKVGRNEPCPCGSGKKYKKCCGGAGG
ncbi:MAG: DUF1186 domain-containing protein [Prosthecobacter sp.]|jgi:uncharacterized protein|uniref:DUF1186 domain-containing protein n=1 Tax=Prosthecobacter sp. TaxID=1965333 RepID=UPI001A007290|nr:DUF1186 domain-containing protein [Prosthecobacter sp.]MBE2286124.1 DUF1186 domain-containing protein [Prosthecobacter sp.]